MKKKIIIYGAHNFAKLLSFYLKDQYEIVCYTIEKAYKTSDFFLDKPLIAFEDIEKNFSPDEYSFFAAIGYSQINKLRERIVENIKAKNYKLVSYIHPTSTISDNVEIKENTFIFENVVIQPFVQLGQNIIIWSNATICHDSIIENNCFIGANACINGFSTIGRNCFLGSNSIIKNSINLGEYNIIGAGCTILKDTKDNEVYKSSDNKLLNIEPENVNI